MNARDNDDGPARGDIPGAESGALPAALDAEVAWIGCAMIDPGVVDAAPHLRAEIFYSEAHRRTVEAIRSLRAEGRPCDSVSVAEWLRERGRLAQVGGMPFLAMALNSGASFQHESWARAILDTSRMREAILLLRRKHASAYVDHGSAADYIADLEREVLALADDRTSRRHERLGPVLKAVYDATARAQTEGKAPGIHRGFADYDAKTLGAHPGDLEIVAARPGMGKTSWAIGVALGVARRPPELFGDERAYQGVAFFSLEMPRDQLVKRILAMEARVDFQALRAADLSAEQWGRLAEAGKRTHGLPLLIDDTPGLDIATLRAKVRRMKAEMARPGFCPGDTPTKLRMVVVDYLGLMTAKGETIRSREQEVSYVSRNLKILAKEEDVAVLALAQLNRALEARSGSKRPILPDLRDSGSIEQDGDVIAFIHREEHYGAAPTPGEEGKTELIVAKQRNGPTGTVFVRFLPRYALFESW
jgi:replicative DNA helicase